MSWPIVAFSAVVACFVLELARQWVRMRIDARARVLPARNQSTIEVKVVGAEDMKRQIEELRDVALKANSVVAQARGTAMLGLHDKPESVMSLTRSADGKLSTAIGPENRIHGKVLWDSGPNAGAKSDVLGPTHDFTLDTSKPRTRKSKSRSRRKGTP